MLFRGFSKSLLKLSQKSFSSRSGPYNPNKFKDYYIPKELPRLIISSIKLFLAEILERMRSTHICKVVTQSDHPQWGMWGTLTLSESLVPCLPTMVPIPWKTSERWCQIRDLDVICAIAKWMLMSWWEECQASPEKSANTSLSWGWLPKSKWILLTSPTTLG